MKVLKATAGLSAVVLAMSLLPAGMASAATKGKSPEARPAPPVPLAPAAFGQIAYISGSTLEVRNPQTGQTTVKLTSKTIVTATVVVPLKAVTKGSCITATGTKEKDGALDADSVTLGPSATGNCLVRAGGRRIFPGAGAGNFRAPASSSAPRRRFRLPAGSATALGKVTSVSGSTISLQGELVTFQAAPAKRPTSAARAALKPKKLVVVVSSKTRFLRTGPATVGSLKVGECATAFGTTNDIGTVTAARLSVSPASSSGCGFGGFGGLTGGPGGFARAGAGGARG